MSIIYALRKKGDTMKFYKRILFPTDFSECANEAYEYALLIANMYNAELHIFHGYHLLWLKVSNCE